MRLLQWRQMDLEYTMWQMMYLCIAPKTVYVPHSAPSLYQPPTHTPLGQLGSASPVCL